MSDKNIAAELEAKLGFKKANFYEKAHKDGNEEIIQAAYDYAPGYMAYLDAAKTEREAVTVSIAMAEKEGYLPYTFGMELTVGGKYYYNNRGRNLYLFRVGTEPINEGIRIAAAHIDSPRIDVKQAPPVRGRRHGLLQDPLLRRHSQVSVGRDPSGAPRCGDQGGRHERECGDR